MEKAVYWAKRLMTGMIQTYQKYWPLLLLLASVLITLGSSAALQMAGFDSFFEYLGLGLLLLGCLARFLKGKHRFTTSAFMLLVLVMILFNAGLLLQNLPFGRILKLIISMGILTVIAIFPSDYIWSLPDLRMIGIGLLVGTVFSTLAALLSGVSVITPASEGFLVAFGYNGGFEHRNYFSYSMIASFTAFYIPYRYGKKDKLDLVFMLVSLMLLLLTNSRGAYIVFAAFVVLDNCTRVTIPWYGKKLTPGQAAVITCIVAIPAYAVLVMISETFYFRINGLVNYLETFGTDVFHMIFGNAEIAFRETGMSYDQNIREVIGWDGSVELVLLNILIKNGLLGLVGYVLIFLRYFLGVRTIRDIRYQSLLYALLLSFVLSAFVESFLANINYAYGTFNYTMIAGLLPMLNRKHGKQLKQPEESADKKEN